MLMNIVLHYYVLIRPSILKNLQPGGESGIKSMPLQVIPLQTMIVQSNNNNSSPLETTWTPKEQE